MTTTQNNPRLARQTSIDVSSIQPVGVSLTEQLSRNDADIVELAVAFKAESERHYDSTLDLD